jgi:ribosomal protein S18 acetylase RimI-like enzyme
VNSSVVELPEAGRLRVWADELLAASWGGVVARRGALVEPRLLPGLVALHDDEPVGLVTFLLAAGRCEIVTIDARVRRSGVGGLLIHGVADRARTTAATALWLITTDDNLGAIAFYEASGFELVARHEGAVAELRRTLKPDIPLTGEGGRPICDELEYRRPL